MSENYQGNLEIIHEGYCHTDGCENYGIVFDAPSLNDVVLPIICGVCFQEFTEYCELKD